MLYYARSNKSSQSTTVHKDKIAKHPGLLVRRRRRGFKQQQTRDELSKRFLAWTERWERAWQPMHDMAGDMATASAGTGTTYPTTGNSSYIYATTARRTGSNTNQAVERYAVDQQPAATQERCQLAETTGLEDLWQKPKWDGHSNQMQFTPYSAHSWMLVEDPIPPQQQNASSGGGGASTAATHRKDRATDHRTHHHQHQRSTRVHQRRRATYPSYHSSKKNFKAFSQASSSDLSTHSQSFTADRRQSTALARYLSQPDRFEMFLLGGMETRERDTLKIYGDYLPSDDQLLDFNGH